MPLDRPPLYPPPSGRGKGKGYLHPSLPLQGRVRQQGVSVIITTACKYIRGKDEKITLTPPLSLKGEGDKGKESLPQGRVRKDEGASASQEEGVAMITCSVFSVAGLAKGIYSL